MLAQGPTTNLTFARHVDIALTESHADQIIGGANALLSCDSHYGTLARVQPILLLPAVIGGQAFDGAVTSWATMRELMQEPGNIKIVKEIDICVNANGIPIPGSFVGCVPLRTLVADPKIALAYSSNNEEGMVLAHEYSHVRGLSHRGDPGALMNPNFAADNKELSPEECNLLYP